jgi:asparagine synthase (glutamine-hydrolysing)
VSAIFGILRFDDCDVDARDLQRMSDTLAHRGPDGRKFLRDGSIGIGHCLMQVNAEDRFEAQPLVDAETGITLVADCRIDNREELAEIFGISADELHDTPDSAFIMRAYKKWGEDCAEHLVGDFAFAAWDSRAGKLVLGRDHMGQRTVFYHKGENFLVFASEIKGLWALTKVPRQLLEDMIFRLVAGHKWPMGVTLYAGISAVPGGTIVTARSDGAIKSHPYWEPRPDPRYEGHDETYYVEHYRKVLTEAVDCRLRRLAGPAVLLNSGGFDTAAIAGLAGSVLTAQGRKLISLCWLGSKATQKAYGDIEPWIEACRRVMSHLDIRYISREGESPFIGIERRFARVDGPANNNYKITDYLDAEAAATGARLIMDGLGGDYTLNPRGFGALAGHLRRGEFLRFFSELRPHLHETGQSTWRMVKEELVPAAVPRSVMLWQRRIRRSHPSTWAPFARRELHGPALKKLKDEIVAKDRVEGVAYAAQREQIRQTALRLCRSFAAGGAIAAAARGLDLTRPFHDKRVVELALAIPEQLYVKRGLNRYLARRALADVYPPEFQTRNRKNEGMLSDNIAIGDAATSDLMKETERLAANAKLAGYFDFAAARRILEDDANKHQTIRLRKSLALNMMLRARFIEWFDNTNRQR